MCLSLQSCRCISFFFFFQAEDGIRDVAVTGVQTCALPISAIFAGLAAGAARVVLGPRGALDPTLVAELLARHGAGRIAVGIDVRDGRVADRASGAQLDATPAELGARLAAAGVRTVVYADAARDGALAGPDVDGARAIADLGLDVIVSGGVASLDDLRRAADAGLAGAIVGRALHEGRFTLAQALACVAA